MSALGSENPTPPRTKDSSSSRKRRRKKKVEKVEEEVVQDDKSETDVTILYSRPLTPDYKKLGQRTESQQDRSPPESVDGNPGDHYGEDTERTKRRRRKLRKKNPRNGGEAEEVELQTRNAKWKAEGTYPFRKARNHSGHKRRRDTIGYQYEHYNHDEEFNTRYNLDLSDILEPADLNHSSSRFIGGHNMPQLRSQETDIVYIQKRGATGFANEHRDKLLSATTTCERPEHNITMEKSMLHFVWGIHQQFHRLSLMLHGLLAGVALSQFVFVMVLAGKGDTTFLSTYHDLALPYHCVYYFLLAITNVSIFERYVTAWQGWRCFFTALLRHPSRAFALIFYMFALILSAGLFQLDNRISMYTHDRSLWEVNMEDHLALWKVINLLRVVASVLGWVTLCVAPNHNETSLWIENTMKKGAHHAATNSSGGGCGFSSNGGQTSVFQNTNSVVMWDGIK